MIRMALLVAVLAAATPALADPVTLSSKSRSDLFQAQTSLLDRRAARQYNSSVRLRPQQVRIPSAGAAPAYSGAYRGEWLQVARDAARRNAIPEAIFLRLVQRESGWNPAARSHKGALGLAQLMPGTAQLLAVDPSDPGQNLDGGARYLRQQYDRFGDWRLALAAYNAGPGAVLEHGGVPPYRETRSYVQAILGP